MAKVAPDAGVPPSEEAAEAEATERAAAATDAANPGGAAMSSSEAAEASTEAAGKARDAEATDSAADASSQAQAEAKGGGGEGVAGKASAGAGPPPIPPPTDTSVGDSEAEEEKDTEKEKEKAAAAPPPDEPLPSVTAQSLNRQASTESYHPSLEELAYNRRKISLDRKKHAEVEEAARKKKEEALVMSSMPSLGENGLAVGNVQPDGEVEVEIGEDSDDKAVLEKDPNRPRTTITAKTAGAKPRTTITARSAAAKRNPNSPTALPREVNPQSGAMGGVGNGNIHARGKRVFPEIEAANNHAKRQLNNAMKKEGSFLRRVIQRLSSFEFYNSFAPAFALTYNAWAIPLRLVFIPEFTLTTEMPFFVFTILDYLSDFILITQIFLLYFAVKDSKRLSTQVNAGASGELRRATLVSMETLKEIVRAKDEFNNDGKDLDRNRKTMSMFNVEPHQKISCGQSMIMKIVDCFLYVWEFIVCRPWLVMLLCAVAVAPIELIPFFFDPLAAKKGLIIMYRTNRLLQILVGRQVHGKMFRYTEEHDILVNTGLQRMTTLFFASALAGHFASCAWFSVGLKVIKKGVHGWAMDADLVSVISDAQCLVDMHGGCNGTLSSAYVEYNSNMTGSWDCANEGHFKNDAALNAIYLSAGIEISDPSQPCFDVELDHWSVCYLKSIYWAIITMITTGFGDIKPINHEETIVCVVSMYFGVILASISIANLTSLFLSMDRAFTEHQQKMDALNKYMRYRHLPKELSARIVAFYEYQWLQLKGVDEQLILSELPSTLKQQVANDICQELLRDLPVLRKSENAMLNAMAAYVESNVFSPGDEIVHNGEQLAGVLIISRGIAEALDVNKRNKVTKVLKRGDYWGLHSLFMDSASESLVKAKVYCEVFTLPTTAFEAIISEQCNDREIARMHDIAVKELSSSKKAAKMFGSASDNLEALGQKGYFGWLKKWFVPDSHFRKGWSGLLFFSNLFNVFITPVWFAVMLEPIDYYVAPLGICYFIDILFWIDFYFQACCYYYVQDGVLVTNDLQLWMKFREKYNFKKAPVTMILEIWCAFPLEIFIFVPMFMGGEPLYDWLSVVRCLKTPRLRHILTEGADFEHDLISLYAFSWMSTPFRRFIKLNAAMYLACHWVGCAFIFMARWSEEVGGDECRHPSCETIVDWRTNEPLCDASDLIDSTTNQTLYGGACSWIQADVDNEYLHIPQHNANFLTFGLYLRSVYFAMVGMSTVGYGDIVPTNHLEMIYATVVILFGGLILPALVGGLATCVQALNAATAQYRAKLTSVRELLVRRHFPQDQRKRVLRYYNYIWTRQGGVDEAAILDELPGPLRQRVAQHIIGDALTAIDFFGDLDHSIIKAIVSVLVPRVFVPDDVVMAAGEIGSSMYLIERGVIKIFSPNYRITYSVLSSGGYFGESCLLRQKLRACNIKCVTYCDCFELTKREFYDTMKSFPEAKDQILSAISRTLKFKVEENRRVTQNLGNQNKLQNFLKINKVSDVILSLGTDSHAKSYKITVGSVFPFCSDKFTDMVMLDLTRMMDPESKERHMWTLLMLLVTMYNVLAIPFRIVWMPGPTSYYADWCLDLIYLIDINLNMYVFGFLTEGALQTDPDIIKEHYKKTRWGTDVFSWIPFEALIGLAVLCGMKMGEDNMHLPLALGVSRFPKVVRAPQILPYLRTLVKVIEENSNFSMTGIYLAQLLFGVFVVSHWAACSFYGVARFKAYHDSFACVRGDDDEEGLPSLADERYSSYDRLYDDEVITGPTQCTWYHTWIELQVLDGKLPQETTFGVGAALNQYIRALNWALPTLVVVVIGDVVPTTILETDFVFLTIFVGMTVNAVIIGNIAGLVANLETDSSIFLTKSDALKGYMHHHKIKKGLQSRVNRYLSDVWTVHSGWTVEDEKKIMSTMPLTLQAEFQYLWKLPYIKKCPFFDFCSEEIIKALALSLKPLRFTAGDTIIQYGDLGAEMYFIETGTVEVVSADDKTVYCELTAGSFFGETALFFKQHRTATIRACRFCEALLLTKADLDKELISREFDLSRMLAIFQDLQKSNNYRNSAMQANLKASENEKSKLYKLVRKAMEESDRTKESWIMRMKKKHFSPNAHFRIVWDCCATIFLFYYAWSIPFRSCFITEDGLDEQLPWMGLDALIDIFFILDIIMRYLYFPYIDSGVTIEDPHMIRAHYRKTHLVSDILASIPFEIVPFIFWNSDASGYLPGDGRSYLLASRMWHVLRFINWFPEYLRLMEDYMALVGIRISSSTTLVSRMFLFFIILNHWCGCIWFGVHRAGVSAGRFFTWGMTSEYPIAHFEEPVANESWYAAHPNMTAPSALRMAEALGKEEVWEAVDLCAIGLRECYTRSFYMVITTISTIGYGDIYPTHNGETLWEITVVLCGCCIFASIIGAWQALLNQIDETGNNGFKEKMARLMNYMNYRGFPGSLKNAIMLHYTHLWESSRCLDDAAVVADLPMPLRMEIAMQVQGKMLSRIPVLNDCSPITKKRLASRLRKQIAAPKCVVYSTGDIGWEVYFVSNGVVDIKLPQQSISPKGSARRGSTNFMPGKVDTESATSGWASLEMALKKEAVIGNLYREGNHFGETCLTSSTGVRLETTTAVTVSELFTISRSEIEAVLAFLPTIKREKIITQFLTRNGHVVHTEANEVQKKTTESMARELKVKSSVENNEVKRNNKKTFGQVAKTIIFSHKIRQRIRARSGDVGVSVPPPRKFRRNSQEDDPEAHEEGRIAATPSGRGFRRTNSIGTEIEKALEKSKAKSLNDTPPPANEASTGEGETTERPKLKSAESRVRDMAAQESGDYSDMSFRTLGGQGIKHSDTARSNLIADRIRRQSTQQETGGHDLKNPLGATAKTMKSMAEGDENGQDGQDESS